MHIPTFEEATALSPLDGRYSRSVAQMASCFSDYELTKQRLAVEVGWLHILVFTPGIGPHPARAKSCYDALHQLATKYDYDAYSAIKMIESRTKHDVKAVEMYIRSEIEANYRDLYPYIELVHFGCTSEDINSLAYARMIKNGVDVYLSGHYNHVSAQLISLRDFSADVAMLSHTHGQTASPTTMGKEINVYIARLERQHTHLTELRDTVMDAKWSGAVGNFNAHVAAYPEINWPALAEKFVTECGVNYNPITTQIESHDGLAMICNTIAAINNIMTDLCVDMWLYISKGYFGQHIEEGEVGSSTMPHKVNPINFENAEGNFGIANALLGHFANKLTKSRLQRDLSDSTVMRSVGSAFGYSALACISLEKGLDKAKINEDNIHNELYNAYEILAEPIQSIMRRYNVPNSYDQLKELTRNQSFISGGVAKKRAVLEDFIQNLDIPEEGKDLLRALKPETYIGYAFASLSQL